MSVKVETKVPKDIRVYKESVLGPFTFRQVICITHLPQLASVADTHFLIEKNVEAEHTYTDVTELDEKSRKNELARIIGGAQITDITIQAASEMLELAEKNPKI